MASKRLEVTIAGDAAGAEAVLAETGAALDALSDKRIDIKADDTELRRKILEDRELIHALETDPTHLGLSDDEARAKVAELKADIQSIGLERARLQLEDADARAKIVELKGELDSIHDKDVRVDVDREGKGREAVADLGKKFDETAGKIPTMVAAAGLLGPAIIPAAAAATAGVGALLVPLTAASLGFGALGLAAIPVMQDLKTNLATITSDQNTLNAAMTEQQKIKAYAQLQHDMAAIPPDQRQVLQGVLDLKTGLNDLSAAVRPQLLGAFTTWLGVAHTGLGQMPGLAREAALGLNDLGTSAQKSLDSPAWHHFLDVITPEIRPAIDSIGRSLGNLVKGLGGVVEAFVPFAGSVESGIERITRAFANWGTGLGASAGFQHFMDYLRQNGPQLKTTVEDVARAGESLVKAFAGFGGFNLKILDDLAKAISAIASAPGGAVALEITALALSAGKLASIAKLGTIVTDLGRLSGAIRAFAGTEGTMASIRAFFDYMNSGKAKIPTETPGTISNTGKTIEDLGKKAAGAAGAAGLGGFIAEAGLVAAPVVAAAAFVGGLEFVMVKLGGAQNNVKLSTQQLHDKYGDLNSTLMGLPQANDKFNASLQKTPDVMRGVQGAARDDSGALVEFAQKANVSFTQAQVWADAGAKGIIDAFSRMPGPISADSLAAMQGLIQAINTGGPEARASAGAVVNNITGDFDKLPGGLSTAGIQAMTALVNAISTNDNNVIGAAEDAVTRAINAAQGIASGDGAAIGEALDQGIITGLRADQAAVGASAAQVAQTAGDLAKAQAAAASPSKVWMELGHNMAEGLVLGLQGGRADVGRAAQALAAHALGSASSGASLAAGPSSYGGLGGQVARIVHIAEGAVQVTVGAESQVGPVGASVRSALSDLVRELRAT